MNCPHCGEVIDAPMDYKAKFDDLVYQQLGKASTPTPTNPKLYGDFIAVKRVVNILAGRQVCHPKHMTESEFAAACIYLNRVFPQEHGATQE